MSDSSPDGDETAGQVDEQAFSCPACSQEITINPEMKAAILSNGCPVCASAVSEESFEK